MDETSTRSGNSDRIVKIAFGSMAIICLLAGLAFYLFASDFGIDPDTARYIAFAFLAAGVGDYLVLRFWDRLKPRR